MEQRDDAKVLRNSYYIIAVVECFGKCNKLRGDNNRED